MIECPYCYRVFRQPPEKLGARCPKCRMALYEDPSKRRKNPEKAYGPCAQHPDTASIAKCSRCGSAICQACRTRWHEEPVCPRCVDQSIAEDEPSPLEAQLQTKQAWVGMVLALFGWMLLLLTLGPLATFHQAQREPIGPSIVVLTWLCFLGSMVAAVFALGNAVAAIRLRGDHRKLATSGLICAGAHMGLVIGIIVLNLWPN
jgi:hypothetical protein